MFKFLLIFLFVINLHSSEKFKIVLPLYSSPFSWFKQIDKLEKIRDKEITTYAIINPKNGPSNKVIQEYMDGIKLLKEYNINVIGYVHTSYGKRDKLLVMEDIYKWSVFYKELGIKGIFFDETSNKLENLDYYKELINYAKSNRFDFNILNAGYTIHESYINENIADIIVTFENNYKAWENSFPSNFNTQTKDTKLSILLHGLEKEDFGIAMHKLKNSNFSYVYLTEDGDDNPWDSISEHFLKYF